MIKESLDSAPITDNDNTLTIADYFDLTRQRAHSSSLPGGKAYRSEA